MPGRPRPRRQNDVRGPAARAPARQRPALRRPRAPPRSRRPRRRPVPFVEGQSAFVDSPTGAAEEVVLLAVVRRRPIQPRPPEGPSKLGPSTVHVALTVELLRFKVVQQEAGRSPDRKHRSSARELQGFMPRQRDKLTTARWLWSPCRLARRTYGRPPSAPRTRRGRPRAAPSNSGTPGAPGFLPVDELRCAASPNLSSVWLADELLTIIDWLRYVPPAALAWRCLT